MENSNNMLPAVVRIKKQLSDFYNGNSWVTGNISTKVFALAEVEALIKIPGHNHTIQQLVGHITAWRNFALQKLTGNDNYDIADESDTNWPSDSEWSTTIKQFVICHNDLIGAVEYFPAGDWNNRVPGRSYSFIYLLEGVVQHDYYHYHHYYHHKKPIRKDSGK